MSNASYKRTFTITSSTGDKKNFKLPKGTFKVHAYRSLEDNLWKFQGDQWGVPETLKVKFVKWQDVVKHMEQWAKQRNGHIERIEDAV